jgi:signal transduction histidine kinase
VVVLSVPESGLNLKFRKTHHGISEAEPNSSQSLYAKLLNVAKVAAGDATNTADLLRSCLNNICQCTDWPFAHARVFTIDKDLDAPSSDEVWRVPFLNPRQFREQVLRMNRLRSGNDWRLRMLRTGNPAVLCNLEEDLDQKGRFAARELGLKSAIGMPVLGSANTKAICEFFTVETINHHALWEEVFSVIANVLSHSIELNTSRKRLREMTRKLLTLQDDERRSLARELHDTTAQNLSMLILNIELLRRQLSLAPETHAKLAECGQLAHTSLQEVRTFSYVLHPPILDELGVFPALRTFIHGFASRTGIAVDFDLPDSPLRMPRDLETTIYRVVQESLSNVRRHSHSSTATVRVSLQQESVSINVEDNGSGLAPSVNPESPATAVGVGISSMRERVQHCGGRFQLHSGTTGTQLQVHLPLPQLAANAG